MTVPVPTKSHSTELVIAAPPEAVWDALTTAEGLVAWYVQDAKVDPHEGGDYWVSWGQGMDGYARILAFDPPHHLRVQHQAPPTATPDEAAAYPWQQIEDYTLTGEGGTTRLRLVHSGFPADGSFEAEYESTQNGWKILFSLLKNFVEHQRGQRCAPRWKMLPYAGEKQPVWERLLGPEGLGLTREGERFSAITAAGDPLTGRIVYWTPPAGFALAIDQLDGTVLCALIEGVTNNGFISLGLLPYGPATERVATMEAQWMAFFERLYPLPAGWSPFAQSEATA